MPWQNTPASRQQSTTTYNNPEYQANRKLALKRAGGRCEQCGRRDRRLQTDHDQPVSQGGTHALANLRVLCSGPGSCHAAKTAREGGGWRQRRADPAPRPRTAW